MSTPLTVPDQSTIEHTTAAAENLGSALSYRIDGQLVLVAKGAHGRALYPLISAALDLVQHSVEEA